MHARDAGRDALAGWISGVAACVDRDVAAAGGISPTAAMARRVLPQIDVGKPLCRRSALGRDRFAVGAHWARLALPVEPVAPQCAPTTSLSRPGALLRWPEGADGGYALAAVVAGLGDVVGGEAADGVDRSEEHTSELQSLMRNSYAVL